MDELTGRLDGRVALVTGASRGMGAVAAMHLARIGASVLVGSSPRPGSVEEAESVAVSIIAAGGNARVAAADLADPAGPEQLVAAVVEEWGRLDIVIANAAVTGEAEWNAISLESWDLVQNVNVRSTYLLARAAHPWLLRSPAASFIAVTSVMADTGQPGALHYTASKAAIIGLVRALAREVGPDGIRVNGVMPGAIQTEDELLRFPDQERLSTEILPLQALKRRGVASDLAGTFGFLAGDLSGFITGQIITVDGGWVMR
ncbi:3-oxoacyl-ACP reductase FabG [Humibacter ginsengiterrae]